MSTTEEFAADIRTAPVTGGEDVDLSRPLANHLMGLGYRKPKVLSYVVVGRDGGFVQDFGLDRPAAQAFADEWISDCKTAGIDWDYRVAEIVEAAA